MAEVSVAALLVCALVLQIRAQGNPEPCLNGGHCQGRCYTTVISSFQTVQMNVGSCPSNANRPACCTGPTPAWQWSAWSACSTDAFPSQSRYQVCKAANGEDATYWDCPIPVGSYSEYRACSISSGNYQWTQWSSWSSCGGGTTQATRTRFCLDMATSTIASGSQCSGGLDRETVSCFSWSSTLWGAWSGCSSGQQQQNRSRLCVDSTGQQVSNTLCPPPAPTETQACPPSAYTWSLTMWGPWSGCGSGQQQEFRSRLCVNVFGQQVLDTLCTPPAPIEIQACPPISPYSWSLTMWGPWTGCSNGQVQETRSRMCVTTIGQQVPDGFCMPPAPMETRNCTPDVTFAWTNWTSWSPCSGMPSLTNRTRTCIYRPSGFTVLSSYCNGSDIETKSCFTWSDSQWGPWSSCSGSAIDTTRQRLCVDSAGNPAETSLCPYPAPSEVRPCAPYNWGQWAAFGSCVAPCFNTGLRYRWKFCEDAQGNIMPDDLCPGDRPINSSGCYNNCTSAPMWTGWAQWSATCSYPQCTKTRSRSCSPSDSSCIGLSEEVRACYFERCTSVSFGAWSEWSTCDNTCRQYRTRVCLAFTACAGPTQESQACNCPLTNPEKVCGKFYYNAARLIDGSDSSTCRWPWMANVRLTTSTGVHTSLCSAVLIDQNTLVTSAICIPRIRNNLVSVKVVLNDQEPLKSSDAEVVIDVRELTTSPLYRAASGNLIFSTGNIGVIHLNRSVGYTNPCIQPVCLPDNTTQFSSFDNYIAGFGRTAATGPTSSALKDASVRVMSTADCQTAVIPTRYGGGLAADLLCTSYQAGNRTATCVRDEGGMLVAQDASGAWVLRGINVDSNCDVTMPSMFVDVKANVNYLTAEMAKY